MQEQFIWNSYVLCTVWHLFCCEINMLCYIQYGSLKPTATNKGLNYFIYVYLWIIYAINFENFVKEISLFLISFKKIPYVSKFESKIWLELVSKLMAYVKSSNILLMSYKMSYKSYKASKILITCMVEMNLLTCYGKLRGRLMN